MVLLYAKDFTRANVGQRDFDASSLPSRTAPGAGQRVAVSAADVDRDGGREPGVGRVGKQPRRCPGGSKGGYD